jgi:hypothetical protein
MRAFPPCPQHPDRGVHPWLPGAARWLRCAGRTADETFAELRVTINDAGREDVPDFEIWDAIKFIYQTPVPNGRCSPGPKLTFDPKYLEHFTQPLADVTIDAQWLEARSQFSCHNRSPAGFLHKIFNPGEQVYVTSDDKSLEGEIWLHEGYPQNLAELNHLKSDHQGVWFLSNPIDGQLHQIDRRRSARNPDGLSYRTAEAITKFRHLVLESDEAPTELWLKALVLLRLPIIAIYHSGRRGAHALVNLQTSTLDQWTLKRDLLRADLIRLGACAGSITPHRLTRLPNCLRGQTGQLQQLLYLTPSADGTPILHRKERTYGYTQGQSDQGSSATEE